MSTKNYIDFNNDFNTPLQWMYESRPARYEFQRMIRRANLAMLGKPSRNLYKEELESNLKGIPDTELDKNAKERCLCVPAGESFIIRKAVGNRANQMASGVDTYEYTVNDPYMLIDDETEDLLAAKCEQDYIENGLEILSSTFSRDLTLYGIAAVLVKYCPISDKNEVLRINPKNLWFDTAYSSTGKERFRGYSTMISYEKLKHMIEEERDKVNYDIEVPDRSIMNKNGIPDTRIKYGNHKITSLNDLDIYVQDMNRLAASPDLTRTHMDYFLEYEHDLKNCYNLNWYQTLATDPKSRTSNGYNGDDVELTVIYDLDRMVEFKIVNRRFVISANTESFRRNIAYPIVNPITDETSYRIDEFHLECPLKFQYEEQENRDSFAFPYSPVFALLDTHDRLCSWRAKREHVSKLLSILRIETNGADATSLRKVLNVMGVVLDDIQGDINSIVFQYDYTPIDSEIQYLENTIINDLHAYDQFDALQSMGDRASAAETGAAVGAIAQGLSTHQNAIMKLYADIARQSIANRVVYSPNQEFPVTNYGEYASVTIQQMALNAIVRVKPRLAREVKEKTLAANAIAIVSNFKDLLTEDGIAYFIAQGMYGQVPRKVAKSFIKDQGASQEEMALAQQQAQNQAQMLQQNQQAYMNDPMKYETQNVMQNASPEEIDEIIAQMNAAGGNGQGSAIEPSTDDLSSSSPESLDMQSQDGSMALDMAGQTSDFGSQMANANAGAF